MAPFIVETGAIVPGANSYATVQQADDQLSQNIHVWPTWNALTRQQKQQLLMWSTRLLDSRAIWNGITTTEWKARHNGINLVDTWAVPADDSFLPDQPLRWPRAEVRDMDNRRIPNDEIPAQLIEATIEMARYLVAQDRTLERPQDGLSEIKADVVTIRFKPDYYLPVIPSDISYIIRGLGSIASGQVSFSKIRRA